jgi:gamma-glutamyltranspeptidase/glutathione hydrolase
VKILEDGGNAVDAAVATAYVLAVTHPSAGNIGGGGFMVVRMADGRTTAIEFREAGPASATTDKVVAEVKAGGYGYASTAVPGTVAGLDYAASKLGTKPLAKLLAPAISLAKRGHKISDRAARSLKGQWGALSNDKAARTIFGKPKGKGPLEAGDKLVQTDLAKTLELIAEKGDAGFYDGPVAEKIDAAMKAHGGEITKADLLAYHANARAPIHIKYRGFDVDTMPPPSMGGVAVAETLLELERVHAWESTIDSPKAFHLFIESAKRSYADRRNVGADPDFAKEASADEVEKLLSLRRRTDRKPAIDPDKATDGTVLDPDAASAWAKKESPETTHFSVVDKDGNAVSCTVTLSASFGAKIVVPGTGVVFSNALGAFSPSGPNVTAPNKHAASSMSPTIVSRNGKVVIVVGSPGGDTIPNTVAQVIRNLIDYGLTVDKAVQRGRVHEQLVPAAVRTEKGREPNAVIQKALVAMGHQIEEGFVPIGDAKVIVVDEASGTAYGVSDDREGGLALGAKKK